MPCALELNAAPRGSRILITLIGRTNVGKSSLLNALVGENVSIISDKAGTTTDAVSKNYELIGAGPVTFYDTAGIFDDLDCDLSQKRKNATMKVLYRTDIALIITDDKGITDNEQAVISLCHDMKIPFITIRNKADIAKSDLSGIDIWVSAKTKTNITELKTRITDKVLSVMENDHKLLNGTVDKGDVVALITPIDSSAPKGRLILPQVQVLREILDIGATAVVAQEITPDILSKTPNLIIIDSQVIGNAAIDIPPTIPLTTFSILFAKAKGDLATFAKGAKCIKNLQDGDKILIAEACLHNYQDDDIGRIKIPKLLQKFTGKNLVFNFSTGFDFPDNITDYKLVIHCGACMLNANQMLRRIAECQRNGVCITNYGMAISMIKGVLDRVLAPFGLKDN